MPPTMPAADPTALPSRRARVLAFLAIVVAGACGALIGYGVVDLQCGSGARSGTEAAEDDGGCDAATGVGAVVGGLAGAGGVAVVATLVLRAVGEAGRGTSLEPPPAPPGTP